MDNHQKRKQNSSKFYTPNITHSQWNSNNLLLTSYDYTNLLENIRLPYETKFGTLVDEHFIQQFEAIFNWCQKPSSLFSMMSLNHAKPEIKLDLSFNEVLFHVLEGSLIEPNTTFKKLKNSKGQPTPVNKSTKLVDPYDVCDARNSPIYAEIPDLNNSSDILVKGKSSISSIVIADL